MKVSEIITEEFLIEGTITIRNAKKLLAAMGFSPTGRQRGSHDVWKDLNGVLFPIPIHGKELDYGITKNLLRIAKNRGVDLAKALESVE